jgi:hypothetical protein
VADEPFSLFATPDTDARRRLGPCRPARRKFANEEAAEDRHGSSSGKNRDRYIDPAERSWRELLTDLDLNAVVAFSLIGLLLALTLMFRFPDLGAFNRAIQSSPRIDAYHLEPSKEGFRPYPLHRQDRACADRQKRSMERVLQIRTPFGGYDKAACKSKAIA